MAQQDLLLADTPNAGRAKINSQTQELYPLANAGYTLKRAARCAVSTNVAIATALENGDSAGGVTLATGDRVLLYGQTAGAENGIYTVPATGAAPRAADANTSALVPAGTLVYVTEGTYADQIFRLTTNDPITLGTTSLTFTEFGGTAPAATETTAGIAEIATTTETNTGTDDARIVTPLKLAGRSATETRAGVIEIATQAETDTGTDDAHAVTPAKLAAYPGLGSGYRTLVTLGSDQTNSTSTLADVTGLSIPVVSGVLTRFYFLILFDSQATATGSRWTLNGPAITSLYARIWWTSANNNSTFLNISAYGGGTASATSLLTGNVCTIEGALMPSASGTLIAQFASEAPGTNNQITAKAGSTVEYW